MGRAPLANNPDGSKRDASSHWVLGATYTTGALSFGAFYGTATQDNGPGFSDREQTVWGVGAAYTVAPGLEVFANYNNIKDENIQAAGFTIPGNLTREVDVVLIGTRLAF